MQRKVAFGETALLCYNMLTCVFADLMTVPASAEKNISDVFVGGGEAHPCNQQSDS